MLIHKKDHFPVWEEKPSESVRKNTDSEPIKVAIYSLDLMELHQYNDPHPCSSLVAASILYLSTIIIKMERKRF
jgi:hypothetical protein